MKKWTAFLPEEIRIMASQSKTLLENSERQCPCCGKVSIRSYYHELNISMLVGASWAWCYNCKRYTHSRIAPLSKIYIFDDPIKDNMQLEFPGNEWYEYLNSLWDKGVLPQTFKLKEEKNNKKQQKNKFRGKKGKK